jgi:4-hydroxy-tetrahydrodipicolinate synthase
MIPGQKTIADRLYVAVLLPLDSQLRVDEEAYRRVLRYFLADRRFARQGGLCVNPEEDANIPLQD